MVHLGTSTHSLMVGVENIALYQGGADKTTLVAMPKGAEVLDVQVTLSGASSTGWSQVTTDTYDEWMEGIPSQMDARSEELAFGFATGGTEFASHGLGEEELADSDVWLITEVLQYVNHIHLILQN